MFRKLLLIFMFICVTKCKRYPYYSIENLYAVLDRTSEYFKNLNNAYESSNTDISNIDDEITKYMETTTKAILQRQKRALPDDLQLSEEVNVLQGFKEDSPIIDLPDFQDIAFVLIQNEHQLLWLAATIDSSKIMLYQLFDSTSPKPKTVLPLSFLSQPNGKRIIINNYGVDILTVVQTSTDEIIILRLGKTRDDTYEFQFKQEFNIPGVVHINLWFGMNQLYLGIASDVKVFLYAWLGEYFDQIDTLDHGARELLFFGHKSFVHVVVVGSFTRIFRFSVRSNKFIEMQKLHGTRDASLFYFKKGHLEEHFLVLADDNSMILYKEMYSRFVPFQRIASARYIYSFMMENTVLLFATTEGDSTIIYQYNGWKFIELHERLSNIRQIRQIRSHDRDMLVVQNQAGEWKFLRPIWAARKTWQTLQNEIEAWCSDTKQKVSQRSLKRILDLKSPVKIPNAYVGQLRTQHINDHNATELIRLTKQYKKIMSKLILAKQIITKGTRTKESMRTILHGEKVTVQCKTNCHIYRLNIDAEIKSMYKSRKLETANHTLKFVNLKAKVINNWKCPIPNFVIDDIFIKESVNGMLMENLQEETLKISGDQEVSGEHFFSNLNTTSISVPLNIATHNTSIILRINETRVEELNLIQDEFFLPLSGPTTTITGSITATKVKIVGLIETRGKITGKSAKKLMLLKDIYTTLTLPHDIFLQNVTFRNLIRAKDIVSTHKSSLKQILENSIPLDSDVPKHVILFSDKIQWDNVTILNYQNWVTKNSIDTVIISGAKFAINNIVLTNGTYENLPIPRLTVPVCVVQVFTQDITSALITVDDLIVEHLYVQNVTGARDLNSTMFDSVSALQSVDFSTKLFTGQVFVKNISVSEIKGIDIRELKSQVIKWIDVDHIKGPVTVPKLFVKTLQMPIYLSLPTTVNNIIIFGNSNIGKINDVNMSSFIENVQKVDDKIFLEHTIFAHEFTSNYTHASYSTLNVSHIDIHPNLHSKCISSILKTSAINVPQIFGYVASNVLPTFVIEGTATFGKEPTVQNIKNVNLEKLSENLWISDQNTVISGSNMYLRDMSIKAKVFLKNAASSLNINVWLDLSSKLLSKTKQQNITVAASFKNVVVPAITAANNSTLQTSDPDLSNLLSNSLMRNSVKAQIVDATWNFEELVINNLYWNGKFNDIDLNTEIVRHDTEQNIITGKKTITNLSTKYLWSYNNKFSKFVKYALIEKCLNVTTIKGRKTFKNISLNNLSIKGKLMGHMIEQALLKSGNQTIFGIKRIYGDLEVLSLISDNAVNDVFLMQLINDQLKNHELVQTIETEIDFHENLKVFGNIIIDGLYEGTDLNNISDGSRLDAVLSRTVEVMELTDNIIAGLHNPAVYLDKFEEIDENTLEITADPDTEDMMVLNSTCVCELKNLSRFCNDTKLLNILAGKNSSTFIMTRLVLLDDTVFVVIISSDFISVYTYAVAEEDLHQRAELHVPDILQASVEPTDLALWIALQLPRQTLVLRYQTWNEFKQYVLPASDTLVTSKTPNNQHLLILSDGVWNLGGIFYPEHICKLPLHGEIKAFALGANYYIKVTKKNSTAILKARYVGN